jgi:hypothetical protein
MMRGTLRRAGRHVDVGASVRRSTGGGGGTGTIVSADADRFNERVAAVSGGLVRCGFAPGLRTVHANGRCHSARGQCRRGERREYGVCARHQAPLASREDLGDPHRVRDGQRGESLSEAARWAARIAATA